MRLDIINNIWHHSMTGRGLYHCLAQRKDGEWQDYYLGPGMRAGETSTSVQPDRDYYFAPLGFSAPERRNKTAAGLAVLFSDIDDGRVVKIDDKLPSYLWRTSPGNYQAAWLLDEEITDYEEWADLNQRLTYFLDADRGGWMGSKVLRIPASYNAKRSGEGVQVYGEVISEEGTVFSPVTIGKVAPPIATYRKATSTDVPEQWPFSEWMACYKEMPLSVKSDLGAERVRDRSMYIIQTINRMIRWGIEPEVIYQLILPRPWNKFRDRPERLWQEVLTAAETAD